MQARIAVADREAREKTRIDFSFTVNPRVIAPLLGSIELRKRSIEEEKALQQQRVVELGGDEEEAYIYNRVDAVGNRQADTGSKIWDNGMPGHRMSFPMAAADLAFSGYNLNNVYSIQKEGSKTAKLVFQFEQKKTSQFPGKAEFMAAFENLCNQSWLNTHIWDNRSKGTITINPSNSFQPKIAAPILRIERTNAKGELSSTGQKAERQGVYFFCNVSLPEAVPA